MRYAIALEQKYSKNEILLGYLNIAELRRHELRHRRRRALLLRRRRQGPDARPGGDARRHGAEPQLVPHRPADGSTTTRTATRSTARPTATPDQGPPGLRARPPARGREDHAGAARRGSRRADHARHHHARRRAARATGQRRTSASTSRTSSRPTPPSARRPKNATKALQRGGLNIYTTLDMRVQSRGRGSDGGQRARHDRRHEASARVGQRRGDDRPRALHGPEHPFSEDPP